MRRTARNIIIFGLAIAVLQGAFQLFFTQSGMEKMLPVFVRVSAEKIKTDSNTYAAYYDMRAETASADIIVIGVDGNVPETYGMLGHFTRFVKQYNNISDIVLDLELLPLSITNILFTQTDEGKYDRVFDKLKNDGGISDEYAEYLAQMFYVNSTMPPNRKFEVSSYSADYSDNEYEGLSLAERIAEMTVTAERTSMVVVDSRCLEYGSEFGNELEAALPTDTEVLYIQTHYTSDCISEDTHTKYSFPFAGESTVYFVTGEKLDGFYSYYRHITDVFGAGKNVYNRLDERYTDYFFVISGSEDDASGDLS